MLNVAFILAGLGEGDLAEVERERAYGHLAGFAEAQAGLWPSYVLLLSNGNTMC